jgi:hypothetical protein
MCAQPRRPLREHDARPFVTVDDDKGDGRVPTLFEWMLPPLGS